MKYSAVIIEDELPARITLKSYLRKYFEMIDVVAELGTVEEAVQYLRNNPPDILFVDVQLKDGTGIDVLSQLDADQLRIVFTTAHDNFTKEAFQNKAFGYLLKPLDPDDFKEIMQRVLKDLKTYDEEINSRKIKIPIPFGYKWIKISDIIRCEAENNYTKLIIREHSAPVVLSKTLKYTETVLINSDMFLRIHQTHLVNLTCIKNREIQNNMITMNNGDKIPVARSKRQMLYSRMKEN